MENHTVYFADTGGSDNSCEIDDLKGVLVQAFLGLFSLMALVGNLFPPIIFIFSKQ